MDTNAKNAKNVLLQTLLLLLLPLLVLTASSSGTPYPSILRSIRVKNHFHRTGEPVDGEQHLRKVILKWTPVAGATRYEVHHVHPHDIHEEIEPRVHVTTVEAGHTCGGTPCHVKPACPLGRNGFSVRAMLEGGEEEDGEQQEETWTPWSPLVRFDITKNSDGQTKALADLEEAPSAKEL
jgi:hypothetical protein